MALSGYFSKCKARPLNIGEGGGGASCLFIVSYLELNLLSQKEGQQSNTYSLLRLAAVLRLEPFLACPLLSVEVLALWPLPPLTAETEHHVHRREPCMIQTGGGGGEHGCFLPRMAQHVGPLP